ncbi:hypothetical protein KVT40_001533 [Elsinoe batatas]|uniref:Alcohol oxidase n=1 Tax=Elsinoe batatas TaxID=2601811 RepID=A0A8K0L573_9PEZI|nr:hypothetical protein KVT40_001533 [Elsinoe batatas]
MGLHDKLPEDLQTVDVIVAGGGSAGCIVAARLTEAYPDLSILLIEQGSNNYQVPEVIHPGLFPRNIAPGSDTALFWQGNHAKQLADRSPVVPSGGILGGGSSINWMVYTRAQRSDFDSWKQSGWTADELLPYLKKFETYHGKGENLKFSSAPVSKWSSLSKVLTPKETINNLISGRADVKDMIAKKHELLGWNSMDASGKFRPTDKDVAALGPDFEAAWKRDFANSPDRPLMIIAMYLSFLADSDHSVLPDDAEYISCANWTAYPYSRGHIHITGPELSDRIDFNVGYLTDPGDVDLKKHIWAYKLPREMFRRMSIYRGELAIGHPRFPAGSQAAVVEKADGPVPDDTPPIQYTEEDDKAIEQKIRATVGTTWHSLGTCKMAAKEQKGVVDNQLSVHGTKGLKLADLSVPPVNVGANTNNTALMIGEKAADLFVEYLAAK